MKTQTIIILMVAVIIIAVGGFLVLKSDNTTPQPVQPQIVSEAELQSPTAYSKGPAQAPVRIVEFSDFQCPACGAEFPILKKIAEEYKDTLRFTYRHFPLSQHANAKPAAYAAEAAGKQGKFWDMHDRLFDKQSNLSEDTIRKIAVDLGLDMSKFDNDRKSEATAATVAGDIQTGTRLKVNATPTLFINGRQFQGGLSYPQLKNEIESRLKGS